MRTINETRLKESTPIKVLFPDGEEYFFTCYQGAYEAFGEKEIGMPIEALWGLKLRSGDQFFTGKCTIRRITLYHLKQK